MTRPDYVALIGQFAAEYERHAPKSAALQARALKVLIDGGNHLVRLSFPFPLRFTEARGGYVWDADGNRVLDFWQGHLANILGHNPPAITQPLAEALGKSWGLQTGFADELQVEVAELLASRIGAERVRFTTSGTLCTMYAIMLARSFTQRNVVLKIGGGWHGAQPWALKGIQIIEGSYDHLESEGLPTNIGGETLVTRYNDTQALEDAFRAHGDRIACFIMEPWMGAGGSMPATPEYLRAARELTRKHGALLILDEVIAGFRFRAGNLGQMYGVQPDLTTMGKIMGGGMPVAMVAGRADVLSLAARANSHGRRVRFDGGTYSSHPLSMLGAKQMISYLSANEDGIYPALGEMGEKARKGIERVFAERGIICKCTGYGNAAIPGSSLAAVHFPYDAETRLDCPNVVSDPNVCDLGLSERVLKLGLLVNDVNVSHGLGSISMAHTDGDLARLLEAVDAVAARVASSR